MKPRPVHATGDTARRQAKFLKTCLIAELPTVRQILRRLKLSERTLMRWLDDDGFRRRWRDVRRAIRRGRDLQSELAAVYAADRIAELGQAISKPDCAEREACITLIRLARRKGDATVRRRAPRTTNAGDLATSSLVHPDVAPELESQLVRELMGNA